MNTVSHELAQLEINNYLNTMTLTIHVSNCRVTDHWSRYGIASFKPPLVFKSLLNHVRLKITGIFPVFQSSRVVDCSLLFRHCTLQLFHLKLKNA
jgi:hypothetical protein